jgi:uncharacterized OsmC-like protein
MTSNMDLRAIQEPLKEGYREHREAPVGFADIRVSFAIDAPGATEQQLAALQRKTERYCVVMQTLTTAPPVAVRWQP